MNDEEKREILQEAEYLISSKAGHLEFSTELSYSVFSDDDSQVFP